MPPKTRFTIYDAMENNGVFSSNPANPGSRDNDGNALYVGPVEYPKMMYHPDGEERVIVPVEIVVTPLGPREHNEQKELIHKIVNSVEEEAELRAEGWFDHPAKAVEVRIKALIASSNFSPKEEKALLAKIPKLSPTSDKVRQMEEEIARLIKLRKEDEEKIAKLEEDAA